MLQTLRAWLNGKREYYTGVALYASVGSNTALLELFKKGQTPYTLQRLQEELLAICQKLKNEAIQENTHLVSIPVSNGNHAGDANHRENENKYLPNEALYQLCKQDADKNYKQIMNLRAELFALARADDFTDPNAPDKVQAREKLAIDVVTGFQKVSQLFDKADYVKQHGRLPSDGAEDEQDDYDALPEHLVKQTLDNLRKNYNKMKKREPTPERLALLQKHKSNIEKLEARWLLLQPAK